MIQDCLMNTKIKLSITRNAIKEAGINVLLSNPDASMSEIAKAAGVGRATLYRHYKTRNMLMQTLARKCLEETDTLLKPLESQNIKGKLALETSIDLLMPMANRFRFLMNLWLVTASDPAAIQIYKRQLRGLGKLVTQAQNDGEISSELSNVWVVSLFDSLLNSAWQLIEQGKITPRDAAVAFKKSFFTGVQ